MEPRSFPGALTAASLGVALKGSFTEFARAQNTAQAATAVRESNVVLPLERRGLNPTCAPIPLTSLTDDSAALDRRWNERAAQWFW
jgi:hypothetical protein